MRRLSLLIIGMMLLILSCWLLCSCRTGEVVTVTRVERDTVYRVRLDRDSVWLHDSVYLHEYEQGETVYVEKAVWHTAVRDRVRVDTVYIAKVDSVPVPYAVERKLTRWERMRLKMGGYAMGCVIVVLLLGAAPWVWRLRRG